jgi:putative flippase GtrA
MLMARQSRGHLQTSWNKFSAFRYTSVHCVLGILNFATAALLFGVLGVNHHVASLIGHAIHVTVGFYLDRRVSFRSPETTVSYGMPRYWVIEAISYSSIVCTMYVMVDLYGMNPYLSRGVVAMLIASSISFGLNKLWTFRA